MFGFPEGPMSQGPYQIFRDRRFVKSSSFMWHILKTRNASA